MLTSLATPATITTAGVIITAGATPDLSPFLRWTLAIMAGGGAVSLVPAGTALLRLKSTAFTAGAGDAVVATGELAGSIPLSLLGLLAPFFAAAVVAMLLVVLARRVGGYGAQGDQASAA
jgi:hypothetical protein